MREWFWKHYPGSAALVSYVILQSIALLIVALMSIPVNAIFSAPVQAAPVAPPEVKECQLVNTAAVNDKVIITVLRCQPENGAPYLINSMGFMLVEN